MKNSEKNSKLLMEKLIHFSEILAESSVELYINFNKILNISLENYTNFERTFLDIDFGNISYRFLQHYSGNFERSWRNYQ